MDKEESESYDDDSVVINFYSSVWHLENLIYICGKIITKKNIYMKKIITCSLVFLLLAFVAVAQKSLPDDIVEKIKKEAFENSKMESLTFYLTDYAGPRLTASRLWERSEQLTKEKLTELGFYCS